MTFVYDLQPAVEIKVQQKVSLEATYNLLPLSSLASREKKRVEILYKLLPLSTQETPASFQAQELLSLTDTVAVFIPFYEEISLKDKIKLAIPLYIELLSETLSFVDVPYFKYVYGETLGLIDLLRTQQTLAGAYVLDGYVYQSTSPEEPLADATVHLCSVEPRKNIIYTHTDSDGYYYFLGVPEGEYVLLALKEGYTVTIAKVEIHSDYYQNFVIYPITVWCFIERICNQYGHVVKIYGIDDKVKDGIRTVTALLFFGDLYGKCTKSASSIEGGIIPLEGASISLVDFPGLDKRGLFEENEEIRQEGEEIHFKCDIRPGDFEAFAFTISGPAEKDLKFKFFLGNFRTENSTDEIKPPEEREYYYERTEKTIYTYRISRAGSRGGSGSATEGDTSSYYETKDRIKIYLKDQIKLRHRLALSQYPLPPTPDSPGGGESGDTAEWLHLTDKIEFPPPITIIGRTVDIYGNPVPNANVIAVEKETGNVISQTTSDTNGFYLIQVPSELEYRIYWSAPGYYTIQGYVKAGNKDIIDDRARIGIESELLLVSGTTFYYEAIFVFWALAHSEGGKIYGYVYNSVTNEPIPNALIWINDGEFVAVSDENGYYEQIVPPGHYKLYATAKGYAKSKVYEGDIYSNWRQDIYLDPAQMTIYVYDAIDSKPELKPIENARILSLGKEYYTDKNGKAEIYVIPGETITIEKARYKSIQIKAVEGEKTVFMHPTYKYIRLEERLRLK
ncbi:MAG: hypothetical protein DRP01_01290 [Archaeoglobales archaeon]|nr:MAG: hypothetical protein DRP01_01290 [Archaeoglobales archaeon]